MQTNPIDVRKFELGVRMTDGALQKFDYRNEGDNVYAAVTKREFLGKKTKRFDHAAFEAISALLADVAPTPGMPRTELLERSRSALHLDDASIEHLGVDVEFADGSEIEAESTKGFWESWERHANLSGLLQ